MTAPRGSGFSFRYRALETLFESCGGSGPKLSPLHAFASLFGWSFAGSTAYILANAISFLSGTTYFLSYTTGF